MTGYEMQDTRMAMLEEWWRRKEVQNVHRIIRAVTSKDSKIPLDETPKDPVFRSRNPSLTNPFHFASFSHTDSSSSQSISPSHPAPAGLVKNLTTSIGCKKDHVAKLPRQGMIGGPRLVAVAVQPMLGKPQLGRPPGGKAKTGRVRIPHREDFHCRLPGEGHMTMGVWFLA